jgi:hypothetical protein
VAFLWILAESGFYTFVGVREGEIPFLSFTEIFYVSKNIYYRANPENQNLLFRISYLEWPIEFLIIKNSSKILMVKYKMGFGIISGN